jgi:hypothetical protein
VRHRCEEISRGLVVGAAVLGAVMACSRGEPWTPTVVSRNEPVTTTSVRKQVLWIIRRAGIIPGNVALKVYRDDPFLKAGWRADISAEAAAQVPSWTPSAD